MSRIRRKSSRPPVRVWPYLLAALVLWLLWSLTEVLVPFLAAAALAYMAVPTVDALARRGLNRTLATTLVLVAVAMLLSLLLLLIVPMFIQQVQGLSERMPTLVDWLEHTVSPWLAAKLDIAVHFNGTSLRDAIVRNVGGLRQALERTLPALTSQGLALIVFLSNLFLTPILAFYLLRDWHGIVARLGQLLPPRWRPGVGEVLGKVDHMVGEFLRGQLTVMVIMAALYGLGWWLVGLDSGFAIGVVAGLLVCIPYVGAFIGVLLATLAAILQFGSLEGLAMVWGVYAVAQTLESFIITPQLVGDRIGLHPALVIFALMAFGSLFGFVGVLLALPVSAVLRVLWQEGMVRYYASRWYQRRITRIPAGHD